MSISYDKCTVGVGRGLKETGLECCWLGHFIRSCSVGQELCRILDEDLVQLGLTDSLEHQLGRGHLQQVLEPVTSIAFL